jgi:hypothetical protein
MIQVQPWLVTGVGGSRIDFVSGWLSCLPGFINNHWSIDPFTGQSVGEMRLMKRLDYNPISLADHISSIGNFKVSPNPDIRMCGSLHGYNLSKQVNPSDNAVIVYINVPRKFYNKLSWEFCVKTYLTKPFIGNIQNQPDVEFIKQQLMNMKIEFVKPHPSAHIVEYEQLFVSGGSRYLCDELKLSVPDRLHQFYDSMLQWADSPLEVTALGQTWKFQDYFK